MNTEKQKIKNIVKRNGKVVPYDRTFIASALLKAGTSTGEFNKEKADALSTEVEQKIIQTYGENAFPIVEDIQDIVEEVMIQSGLAHTARAYILYRSERKRERESKTSDAYVVENIPYKKIYEVLRWNLDHGCDSIDGLNKIIAGGQYPDLVEATDKRYHNEVRRGAELMISRLPDIRMIIIAGPSSSGKTTTMIKASEKLKDAGKKLKGINLDHYFFDLEMHPKDEFGDYDYETPQALDLELIDHHLSELLNGKSIKTPDYDFQTGTRTLNVHELHLEDDELLLIDSLHGLYEKMTQSIPQKNKFRLYIETLGQLRNDKGVYMRWADNRLLRRMIRDSWHRNLKPLQTLTHWHYVRRSELQNIIPFIGTVDYLVNSALPYELPILKDRLFHYFPEAIETFKNDSKRHDAFLRAKRVHDMLETLQPVKDDSPIPDNALLREFIGGSKYSY